MSYSLHVSRPAETDLAEAIHWYERVRPGLGADLTLCVEATIARVLANPHAFPVVHLTARRALIRRFPYALLFRIRDNRVEIEAVFHGRRDPAAWHQRIG